MNSRAPSQKAYNAVVPPRFVYRYRPLNDEFSSIQEMLKNDRWWFGSRLKFDDEEDMKFLGYEHPDQEAARRAAKETQEFMDNTGILCLSRSASHPTLWKKYAADGKGICIKLESDYLVEVENGPFRVTYSNRPKPLWKPFAENPDPLQHLLQKKRCWDYQGEWRCIVKWNAGDNPTVGYRSLLSKRGVAGVIFGWQTDRDDRLRVLDWLGRGRWLRRLGVSRPAQMQLQEARVVGGSVQLFDWD